MPKRRYLTLSKTQREELMAIRDRHQKAYMREKAAALLKISKGQSPHDVALHGLLKPHAPDTIYAWMDRYEKEGIAGLRVKAGRGRKPAFSPKYATEDEAKEGIFHVLRRSPEQYGHQRSRWTLSLLLKELPWLRLGSVSGLSRLLKRLGIHYKRGRDYVHSPDPAYQDKVSQIELKRLRALYAPERFVFLYLDEFTYYRQPTLAQAYELAGHTQPLAVRSHGSNLSFRVLAALNIVNGQVTWIQRKKIGTNVLVDFWYTLRKTYPDAEVIYVALDNWPVHFHPDVLAPLQPQQSSFSPRLPGNWPTEPSPQAKQDDLPIQLLPLPTYASWLNPIEKLWRWLKQAVLHLHRHSDEWPLLRSLIEAFLNQFTQGSPDLLRYTGLLPP